jgi:hypothetical protein
MCKKKLHISSVNLLTAYVIFLMACKPDPSINISLFLGLAEVFVNSQSLVLVEDKEQRERDREKPNHGGSKIICPKSKTGFVLLGPVRIIYSFFLRGPFGCPKK